MLNEFESIHGSTTDNKNFIHFLLKYRYTINWDREAHENYFLIYTEDVLAKMADTHSLIYLERFRVKFLDDCIYNDFYVKLRDFTHAKMIFEIKK